jgi:nucleotidyltransferase substrate binding protein (TIGR01987 family)
MDNEVGTGTEERLLDVTPLKKAVKALEKCVAVYGANAINGDYDMRDALRSGVIKNFEIAYESCWKYMKKWLEMNIEPNVASGVPRREFYRIARENGLIQDVREWWEFHRSRNETVHIYDEVVAEDVFEVSQRFVAAANRFIADLEGMI